jgi:hypothetical protein
MFDSKKKLLWENPSTSGSKNTKNTFVQAAKKDSAKTVSGNQSLKFNEQDNVFTTDFSQLSKYTAPRSYADVSLTMSELWKNDPLITTKLALYVRTVTRKTNIVGSDKTENTQRGAGLRNEGMMRMLWLAVNHPDTFYKNAHLYFSVAKWKDFFEMLRIDLMSGGSFKKTALDWDRMFQVLQFGMDDEATVDLIKKYMPQIKAKSACNTAHKQANHTIGAWLANKMFEETLPGEDNKYRRYKAYRKFKSQGNAHQWQQLMSANKHDEINFATMGSLMRNRLSNSGYFERHNIEKKFEQWLDANMTIPFVGYAHEIFATEPKRPYQEKQGNKAFYGLVERMDINNPFSKTIILLDSSGSMFNKGTGAGGNANAYTVAASILVLCNEMMPDDNPFKDMYFSFGRTTEVKTLKGSTPWKKYRSVIQEHPWGGTNFISGIEKIIQLGKSPEVSINDLPNRIIALSDGEFNQVEGNMKGNFEKAIEMLREAFGDDYADNFQIVLWDMPNNFYGDGYGNNLETYEATYPNCFYFGSYDASILHFLFGQEGKEQTKPKNQLELFQAAMDQTILNMIEI